MTTYSPPELPTAEIITVLAERGIAAVNPEDISKPTSDFVRSLYRNLLAYFEPTREDPYEQISFATLEILENPDHHTEAIRTIGLYRKFKDLLSSIHVDFFNLQDILRPDARRTLMILSNVVNFIYYKDEKLNMLQPIVDNIPANDERRMELEAKIEELNKELLDHEVTHQMEEPMVQELDAELKELRHTIQSYNKQQASLKTLATGLKEKIDVINEKISNADYELVKSAQENSKLLSDIVQSPDKLQGALEEKKANRNVVKNSERVAMLRVQEKTAKLEVYSKALDKMSKHFTLVQAIQEQVNSAKTVDKDVKALKAKLSDVGVLNVSLEAKIVERQGGAKQLEELIKAAERERDMGHGESSQRLEAAIVETKRKLASLEPREREVEAMLAKGESLRSEADSVKEAGKVTQGQLLGKSKEILQAFDSYSNSVGSCLQRIDAVNSKRSPES